MNKTIPNKEKILLIALALIGVALFEVSQRFWGIGILRSLRLLSVYFYLIPLAHIDRNKQIIPNRYLPAGLVLAALFLFLDPASGENTLQKSAMSALLGLLFGAGVFLLASFAVKGGVGMGDIKLFGVLGCILGFQTCFSMLVFTLLSASVCGVGLLIAGKAGMKTRVAVAPFALAGMAITILAGG